MEPISERQAIAISVMTGETSLASRVMLPSNIRTDKKYLYRHPQMVSTGDRLVILYEKCAKKTGKLKGVFYMVLDPSGNVISESKKFKPNASLNPCETPVYSKGSIYWVSNKSSRKGKMFVYRIKLD